jgi:peptidoglycan/LPS O-acetylase OafA/YrhL
VWPLVVLVCSRRALLATIVGLVVVTPLLRGVLLAMGFGAPVVYPFTLCRLDELAMGALLAVLVTTWPHERIARLARWGLGGSLTYLVLVIAIRRKALDWANWTMLGPGFSALAVAAAAIVVFAIAPRETRLKRCLEGPILRTFGKYSYGAYVFHTPIEPVCLRYFPHERIARLAEGLGFTASRVAGVLGFAVLGIAVTMTLAILSYHAFEKPFLKLKRYFEYRSSTVDVVPAGIVSSDS